MSFPIQFSLNAILMMGLGASLGLVGAYAIMTPYLRLLAVGLIFTSAGCILCGLTDGFTDPTPRGFALRKLGYAAFLVGIPLLAYSTYYFV